MISARGGGASSLGCLANAVLEQQHRSLASAVLEQRHKSWPRRRPPHGACHAGEVYLHLLHASEAHLHLPHAGFSLVPFCPSQRRHRGRCAQVRRLRLPPQFPPQV
uniref:Uncharacterized protein n=1 Tax=Arundo donax TaxID=35708 RepID=A0A0A8ZII2_ARUDO